MDASSGSRGGRTGLVRLVDSEEAAVSRAARELTLRVAQGCRTFYHPQSNPIPRLGWLASAVRGVL